jgi:hypothetical protein
MLLLKLFAKMHTKTFCVYAKLMQVLELVIWEILKQKVGGTNMKFTILFYFTLCTNDVWWSCIVAPVFTCVFCVQEATSGQGAVVGLVTGTKIWIKFLWIWRKKVILIFAEVKQCTCISIQYDYLYTREFQYFINQHLPVYHMYSALRWYLEGDLRAGFICLILVVLRLYAVLYIHYFISLDFHGPLLKMAAKASFTFLFQSFSG